MRAAGEEEAHGAGEAGAAEVPPSGGGGSSAEAPILQLQARLAEAFAAEKAQGHAIGLHQPKASAREGRRQERLPHTRRRSLASH